MGMILGHHLPLKLIAPAADSCSYTVKFDGPTIDNFSSPGGFRYDVRIRPDGLRVWTHWTISFGGFDTHQYDLPAPWDFANPRINSGNILRTGSLNRSMEWHDSGNKLTFLRRWFSSFRRIDTYDQSATPYDISAGLGPVFASLTAITGPGEFLVRFSLDGFKMFTDISAATMQRYNLAIAHDISSSTGVDQIWNYGAAGIGSTNTWEFSADHTRVYFVTQTGDLLASFDLTAPDDISAPFNFVTGVSTNLPSNLGIARGMNIRPDTGDIILLADQNNQRIRCWAGGVAPTTDPILSSVVLLLDFAGPDGGTNITDLSPSGHTETFHGDAKIDTLVRSKGNNTLQLDGVGDYVDYPQSSDFDFPGDFTVECDIRFNAPAVGTSGFLSTYDVPTTNGGWWLQWSAGNLLRFGQADSPGALISRTFAPVANQMYSLAVTRAGTDLRMFIDGVQQGIAETDSTNLSGSTVGVAIGVTKPPNNQDFDGYIGSVRLTKGVARYTSGYTPPGCGFPSDPVPPSPVTASGAPSITKPTSAGAAVVTSTAAIVAGPPLIGSGGAPQIIPNAPIQGVGDRIFVYGANEVPTVDGTWTQLATAPTSFFLFTKIAAGDVTDQALTQGSSVGHAVFIKFTMVDPGGIGVWDFNAQSTLRNTFRTAFDNNSLAAFGTPAPSCSFFAGLRIGSGVQPGTVGDFSDPLWNAPPNGGTILKVKTSQVGAPFNTYWHGISFLCEPTKVAYATGKKWVGANEPTSHLTQTRGFRYDHD